MIELWALIFAIFMISVLVFYFILALAVFGALFKFNGWEDEEILMDKIVRDKLENGEPFTPKEKAFLHKRELQYAKSLKDFAKSVKKTITKEGTH